MWIRVFKIMNKNYYLKLDQIYAHQNVFHAKNTVIKQVTTKYMNVRQDIFLMDLQDIIGRKEMKAKIQFYVHVKKMNWNLLNMEKLHTINNRGKKISNQNRWDNG